MWNVCEKILVKFLSNLWQWIVLFNSKIIQLVPVVFISWEGGIVVASKNLLHLCHHKMNCLLNCHHFLQCHHFYRRHHLIRIRRIFFPEIKKMSQQWIFFLIFFFENLFTFVGDTVGDTFDDIGIWVIFLLRSIALVRIASTLTRARLFINIFGEFWNCRLIVLSPSKTDFKSRAHFINGLFVSIWNTFRFAVRFVTFARFWLANGEDLGGGDELVRGGVVEIDLVGGDNLVSDISRPQMATISGFDGEWLWNNN